MIILRLNLLPIGDIEIITLIKEVMEDIKLKEDLSKNVLKFQVIPLFLIII